MSTTRVLLIVVFAALATLVATPTLAQTRGPNGPYRGLFGGGAAAGNLSQSLTATGAAGGGYSKSGMTTDSTTGSGTVRNDTNTSFEQASAGLDYSLSLERLSVSSSLGTGAAYFPVRQTPLVQTYYGGLFASFRLTSQTTVQAGEDVAYRPLVFQVPLAGLPGQGAQAISLDPWLGASVKSELTRTASAGFRQGLTLTRKLTASFNYSYGQIVSSFGDRNLQSHAGRANISFALGKGLGLQLGYGYTVSLYETPGNRQRVHGSTIDGGLHFDRALSITRKMTLEFGTGLTGLSYLSQDRYHFVGHARLSREIGRTWDLGAGYNRAAEVIDAFRQPVFSDALTVSLGGQTSRRVQFHTAVGVSTGNIGFVATGNRFKAYYAGTGFNIGVTRLLGVGVDYSYYRYLFGTAVVLPSGLLRSTDRQTLRVRANMWVPLLTRTRRLNASR